eukprot:6033424-Prymnesium_polylepis.1
MRLHVCSSSNGQREATRLCAPAARNAREIPRTPSLLRAPLKVLQALITTKREVESCNSWTSARLSRPSACSLPVYTGWKSASGMLQQRHVTVKHDADSSCTRSCEVQIVAIPMHCKVDDLTGFHGADDALSGRSFALKQRRRLAGPIQTFLDPLRLVTSAGQWGWRYLVQSDWVVHLGVAHNQCAPRSANARRGAKLRNTPNGWRESDRVAFNE